ncbi:unnamed protein product [Polarella glacialis]|uniref:SET domain-containing protein n=1 Tax=Polarella glacialis TaxID=89957 RepID=A0A813D6Y9_POLGL|nr:unnamed protein product [Polarella glacialis]
MAKGVHLVRSAAMKKQKQQSLKRSKPSDVQVRESTLRGAGNGLFAVSDFARGTLLPVPYKGRQLTLAQFKQLKDFRWCFQVQEGNCWAVDGKMLKVGNPLRWVNGARSPSQLRRVNVVGIKLEDGKAWYVTTKPVTAGSEFIIDYGPGYWKAYDEHWAKPERLRLKVKNLREALRAAQAKKGTAKKQEQLQEMLEDALDELDNSL